jgi:UDP-N-acetyl-D-glucosamine dehydrogenase
LGGHCIPCDPHYLSWKIKQVGYEPRFIALASEINGKMPEFIVEKVQGALNEACKSVKGSKIHVLGVAYKRDISDVRESPALDIIALLQRLGGDVTYSDPFVPKIDFDGGSLEVSPLFPAAEQADCVVIITDHRGIDYAAVVENAVLIVDSRNALKKFSSGKIVRL